MSSPLPRVAFPPQGEGGPAFPPQGEGGPLAVDEVPERSEGFSLQIEKDLIRHPPRVRSADATFPVRGEGLGVGRFLRLSKT